MGHCPHLGGASVIHVAHVANFSEDTRESSLREIRVLEERNSELLSKVVSLQDQLERTKLELKIERQNKFAANEQDDGEPEEQDADQEDSGTKNPRGAPVGHPGWFRKMPEQYDWDLDVDAPRRCPCCASRNVVMLESSPPQH